MKIAVLLRNVPDLVEDLPLADNDVDWDEVSLRLNDFDDHALEECVIIKEESGGEVIAVALENAGDKLLQIAVARGADRAVKIMADVTDGASSRELAPIFCDVLRKLEVDLVVTGVQTPNDVYGQLLPYIAHAFDWPQVNGVVAIRSASDSVEVTQEYGGGRSAVLAMTLPAAVAIQSARQAPRYVSGSKLRQAVQSASIVKMEAGRGPDENRARVIALKPPAKGQSAQMIADDADEAAAQIVELLKQNRIAGA